MKTHKEIVFSGRLALSGPRHPAEGIDQYIIGGAVLSKSGQPVTKSDGWEMIECEVIIRPTKIHRKGKSGHITHGRLDHVVMSLGDEHWEGTEVYEQEQNWYD